MGLLKDTWKVGTPATVVCGLAYLRTYRPNYPRWLPVISML